MGYSYEVAKDNLSDNEKNRLLCIYLNSSAATIDWAKATKDFGCASVDSMKVSTRNVLKKIENAGGKTDDDGAAVAAKPGSAATPKKSGGGGRKRKAATPAAEGEGEDEDAMPTQKKAKKGKATPKAKGKKDSPMKAGDSGAGGEREAAAGNDAASEKEVENEGEMDF